MTKQLTNQYQPDSVASPGETILETIEALGMKQVDLAKRMGRPVKTISELLNAKVEITPDTALQLERVLNVPARFWLNLEQNYREFLARQAERTRLEQSVDWMQQLPLKDMIIRGWVAKANDPVEQSQLLLNFFGVASPQQWQERWLAPSIHYRKSTLFQSDPGAVAVWLRQGELQAQQLDCPPYDVEKFRAALQAIRLLTNESPELFEPRMIERCAAAGVAVVLTPPLSKIRISGATYWLPQKAVIQLTLRYKTNDHFWFSFFHEAGHILKHGKRDIFLEDSNERQIDEDIQRKEDEANHFARDFLIPGDRYRRLATNRPYISKEQICAFAKELGIAPGIVVGRLQHEGDLPRTHCNDLKVKFEWTEAVE